jgi:excisionase family DNA binding protein
MTLLQLTGDELKALISKTIKQALTETFESNRQQTDDKMLSVEEVARLLSVSARSVTNYTKEGLLKSYRLKGSVRYKSNEVLQGWQAIDHGR